MELELSFWPALYNWKNSRICLIEILRVEHIHLCFMQSVECVNFQHDTKEPTGGVINPAAIYNLSIRHLV